MSTLVPFASILGWLGALGTVVAYGLVSQRVLTATSRTFQATNAVSAGLLTVSALAHDSWPSAVANSMWVGIALAALLRSLRTARRRTADAAAPEPVGAEEFHAEERVVALSGRG